MRARELEIDTAGGRVCARLELREEKIGEQHDPVTRAHAEDRRVGEEYIELAPALQDGRSEGIELIGCDNPAADAEIVLAPLSATAVAIEVTSASAPPSGANKKPGNMRATITRPTAAAELDTFAAMLRIASRPIQSPRLDANCAPKSGRNTSS